MRVTLYLRRARRGRGAVLGIVLLVGLVGGIALSSLAGARRTASTFAAYARDVQLSDLAVNTFTPDLGRVAAIAKLPGVRSSASYVGLNANPVVHGKEDPDFRFNGVFGSLDGRFFGQDRATVVHGRLPSQRSQDEVALTVAQAKHLGAHVGDRVTYVFHPGAGGPGTRSALAVVGIVRLPPVIVDENDIIEGLVLSPAGTKAHLASFYFTWQGIRLDAGGRGIDRFVEELATNPTVDELPPVVQRYDVIRTQAQRSVRPQAIALGLFGVAAALATLALSGQAVGRMVGSWGAERAALQAAGLTRAQMALASALEPAGALLVGTTLALVVATALSPLAPVGGVRAVAPDTGVHLDLTALLGAAGVLLLVLLVLVGALAWRVAIAADVTRPRARASVASRAARLGLPVPVVIGAGFALDPSPARARGSGRLILVAGAVATVAVAAAGVFGQSLDGLVSHPARFGWNWDRMLVAEAGYGSLDRAVLEPAVAREPQITSWATLAFGQGTVRGQPMPLLGLAPGRGAVGPRITEGRTVAAPDEVVVGRTTLRTMHRSVGDQITVGVNGRSARLRIVGVAVLPSIGQGAADHTSLGRGMLLRFDGLADLTDPGAACRSTEDALCPQALIFDVARGADGAAVARRIAATDPDGVPAGTYEQGTTRAADIRNYEQMRSLPVALALVLAVAALLGFGFALVGSVRVRQRELAVLRGLGLTARQLRTAMATQALVTAAGALLAGVPLGIAAGRSLWIQFANSVGVAPRPVVQGPVFGLAAVATLLGCGLLAVLPARLAARSTVGALLRSD